MLGDQQIGDEVAAQHEKDVNPEETARRHAHPDVESDNGEHRKRPDAVETGNPTTHMPALAAGIDRDGGFLLRLPELPGLVRGPGRTFLHQLLRPPLTAVLCHLGVRANAVSAKRRECAITRSLPYFPPSRYRERIPSCR